MYIPALRLLLLVSLSVGVLQVQVGGAVGGGRGGGGRGRGRQLIRPLLLLLLLLLRLLHLDLDLEGLKTLMMLLLLLLLVPFFRQDRAWEGENRIPHSHKNLIATPGSTLPSLFLHVCCTLFANNSPNQRSGSLVSPSGPKFSLRPNFLALFFFPPPPPPEDDEGDFEVRPARMDFLLFLLFLFPPSPSSLSSQACKKTIHSMVGTYVVQQ